MFRLIFLTFYGEPKMPKVLMLENVKNIRSHDNGKTARVITKSLRELGYSVFWNLFNTSVHTDIPQNRERTFIICFKDEADWEFNPGKKSSSAIFNSYLPLSKSKGKKNGKGKGGGKGNRRAKNSRKVPY